MRRRSNRCLVRRHGQQPGEVRGVGSKGLRDETREVCHAGRYPPPCSVCRPGTRRAGQGRSGGHCQLWHVDPGRVAPDSSLSARAVAANTVDPHVLPGRRDGELSDPPHVGLGKPFPFRIEVDGTTTRDPGSSRARVMSPAEAGPWNPVLMTWTAEPSHGVREGSAIRERVETCSTASRAGAAGKVYDPWCCLDVEADSHWRSDFDATCLYPDRTRSYRVRAIRQPARQVRRQGGYRASHAHLPTPTADSAPDLRPPSDRVRRPRAGTTSVDGSPVMPSQVGREVVTTRSDVVDG